MNYNTSLLLLQGYIWNVSFITSNPPLLHISRPVKKKEKKKKKEKEKKRIKKLVGAFSIKQVEHPKYYAPSY
jgi:hypothetical protein